MPALYRNEDKGFTSVPVLTRTDADIDFNWGNGSPDPAVNPDHFTVQWSGKVLPQTTDEYTFYFTGDDGFRVWVDDQLIIDKWQDQETSEFTGKINLEKNVRVPIKVEYYESDGQAVAFLSWSTPKLQKHVIPSTQLFSGDETVVTGLSGESGEWLKIYPTSVQKNFNVEYSGPTPASWALIDMLGRPMITGETSSQFVVDASSLAHGVYLFKVGEKTMRILKN